MCKIDKVVGASILFAIFFIGACVSAYLDTSLRSQLFTFIFMGLGALYSILLVLIDPKPKQTDSKPLIDKTDTQPKEQQP